MATTTLIELSHRARAVLRAVGAGRCEISGGSEPDLFVDGLAFCDQLLAHALSHAGLLRPTRLARLGDRVVAELTAAGFDAIR